MLPRRCAFRRRDKLVELRIAEYLRSDHKAMNLCEALLLGDEVCRRRGEMTSVGRRSRGADSLKIRWRAGEEIARGTTGGASDLRILRLPEVSEGHRRRLRLRLLLELATFRGLGVAEVQGD